MKKDIKKLKLLNDKHCKNWLSKKKVLAIIIKTFISDFEEYDYETIEKCIVGYSKDEDKIKSLKTKYVMNNTYAQYDLLYKVKLPNSDKDFDLMINIEPQGDTNLDYPLEYRATYYSALSFVSQMKKEVEYKDLKKVYSIWICADRNAKEKTSIEIIEFKKNIQIGVDVINSDYRLINYVIVTLGEDIFDYLGNEKESKNKYSYFLELMRIILTKEGLSEKNNIKKLENSYNINVTKEDTDNMHWSQDIEDSAFKKGISQGISQGELSAKVFDIDRIMSSFNVSFDKAADVLKLDEETKEKIQKEINNNNN